MNTRSKSQKRATSSPPREVTEGNTGPVSDAFVGRLSSATGLPRDGNFPSRSAPVEVGPRSVCSESVDVEQGPAQGVEHAESRIFAEIEYSDISSPDNPPISTQHDEQPLPTANRALGMIKRTIRIKEPAIMVKLYKALVRPHLNSSLLRKCLELPVLQGQGTSGESAKKIY